MRCTFIPVLLLRWLRVYLTEESSSGKEALGRLSGSIKIARLTTKRPTTYIHPTSIELQKHPAMTPLASFIAPTRTVARPHFKLLMGLLVILVLPLSLLACGGNEGTTQEPVPAATPAPAQPATPAPASPAQPASGTEEIFIRAGSDNGFTLTLNAGDVVAIDYVAESRIQGRSESGGNIGGIESGVQFAVTDPIGEVISKPTRWPKTRPLSPSKQVANTLSASSTPSELRANP